MVASSSYILLLTTGEAAVNEVELKVGHVLLAGNVQLLSGDQFKLFKSKVLQNSNILML
jgi:hypothetical protein